MSQVVSPLFVLASIGYLAFRVEGVDKSVEIRAVITDGCEIYSFPNNDTFYDLPSYVLCHRLWNTVHMIPKALRTQSGLRSVWYST